MYYRLDQRYLPFCKPVVHHSCLFLILSLYCTVLFLTKRQLLLPTNHKLRGLVGSQNGINIHSSGPISLQDPAINLYTSVVDFIYFRWPVELAL